MTNLQMLLTLLALTAGIQLTRWLPFWLFRREVPPLVTYLGGALPCAAMGLLVVYCLKGVSLLSAPHGVPELIAIAAVTALHKWKGNVLLSIAGGTVLYMLFAQRLFA